MSPQVDRGLQSGLKHIHAPLGQISGVATQHKTTDCRCAPAHLHETLSTLHCPGQASLGERPEELYPPHKKLVCLVFLLNSTQSFT